jgi:uncharacterized protein (DUF1499 family)
VVRKRNVYILTLLLLLIIPVTLLAAMNLFSRKPAGLGVTDGMLTPCPDSPNCVSSQATDAGHRMEPIPVRVSGALAIETLRLVISRMPRSQIITSSDNYLHAEFRTALFRFVDDVEFFVDGESNVVHFRSASRLGWSDLGVNRKRMEAIRREFEIAVAGSTP